MNPTDIPTTTATLKNGTAVTLRALRPDDRERMAQAVRGLEAQTIYTRLFSYRKELTDAGLDRLMNVDFERDVAIVATTGSGADELIIGGARYVGTAEGRAEVAFTVEEDYQGQGVAGRLFEALLGVARARGVRVFEAEVLAENPSMLRVFERTGLPVRRRSEGGIVHLDMALAGPKGG